MPAQNLQKIEWTTLQEFISKINANFAIIQNSPLFKGIPGESVEGPRGPAGLRGCKFLFVKYDPNFVNAFNLTGGSTNDIDAAWLTAHSDDANIQNLLTALETNDLIDGDVIVLESTTELIKVTTTDLGELVFTPTGIYLSQEIAAFNQLQTLYDNTVQLINSISIEQNIVIDRFSSIALSFGYPSSANIPNPNITPNSVYYPYIEGVSDFYNSGVNATEEDSPYNHLFYALSKQKYDGIHNYTFVNGNVEDLISILDNTQSADTSSTSLQHSPTRDFLPAQIILQNNSKEGIIIGNKNTTMNNYSKLFKNSLNELVLTSFYENNINIDNGNITRNNYRRFNYGLLILSQNRMYWNKAFENFGTMDLIGDFIQSNNVDPDDANSNLTYFDTPHLRTRKVTSDHDLTHIEIGFVENNSGLPYQHSNTEIFTDNMRLIDHDSNNGFGSIFLYTDQYGNIRKDIFKESVFGNDVKKFSDDIWAGNGNYNMEVFLNGMERTDNDKQVVTSDYLAALIRLVVGVEGDGAQRPYNLNIRNFEHAWLMEDFAPVFDQYSLGKSPKEISNDSHGWFGYERIPSLELNKNLIIGKSSDHLANGRKHNGDQLFRVLQGNKNGYVRDVIAIGNMFKSYIPSEFATADLLGDSAVNDISQDVGSDSIIFMKWRKLLLPGIKPRTVLCVSPKEDTPFGEVIKNMQFADYAIGTGGQTHTQATINQHGEPSEVSEKGLLDYVEQNIDNENVFFEIAFALKTTNGGTNSFQDSTVNKYSGGSQDQPFRKKLLTGSHWRILWGAFDKLRMYIKNNFYTKDETDQFVAPIGSIIAWTPLQDTSSFVLTPQVTIPKGWVPCFGGTAIVAQPNGQQRVVKVPDLVNKFVLGEYVSKYYIDGTTMRVVCNGGLISSSKYAGDNFIYLKEKHIPPHIHQHTHDANGVIKARVVVAKLSNIYPHSGTGGGYTWFKDWNDQITTMEIDIDSSRYKDRRIPTSGDGGSYGYGNEPQWNTVKPWFDNSSGQQDSGKNTPISKYPREWSQSTRARNTDGSNTPFAVNQGLSVEDFDRNPVDNTYSTHDIIHRPSNGNNWTGVFGGATNGDNKKVQSRLDLVSKHIKLIYIYRVGVGLTSYSPDTHPGTPYPISNVGSANNFGNDIWSMQEEITDPIIPIITPIVG